MDAAEGSRLQIAKPKTRNGLMTDLDLGI